MTNKNEKLNELTDVIFRRVNIIWKCNLQANGIGKILKNLQKCTVCC